MTVARRSDAGWTLTAPRPVGDPGTLLARLVHEAEGGAVALGADLPIGLPRAYAAGRSEADFPAFLRQVHGLPDFFSVCPTISDIRADRPFYPARGIKGMTRLSHALALGLPDAAGLSRACDRATAERPAGAPLFWTLGANQSGKAAIAAWQSMILPAIADDAATNSPDLGTPAAAHAVSQNGANDGTRADLQTQPGEPRSRPVLRLWPFDGPFLSLLSPGAVALAETYPAEALRHLGIRLRGSKRRQMDRCATAGALVTEMDQLAATPDDAMRAALMDGFGADAAGEDRFDSVLGLLCVLNVLVGNRPDTAPDDPWISRWEGWVLGQTALPLARAGEFGGLPEP